MGSEEWRDIVGYSYKVSSLGRVWSYRSKKYLKPCAKGRPGLTPYLSVTLYGRGKRRQAYVHRLVAEAFLQGAPTGCQINHIDGNKFNNSLNNLEWCTARENMKHAKLLGLHRVEGSENGRAKLTNKEVLAIRAIGSILSYRDIASLFNIGVTAVQEIITKKKWKHL